MSISFSVNVTDYHSGQDNDYTSAFGLALIASRNIVVPPGRYFVSDTIIIPANTQITGAGIGVTIIVVPEKVQKIKVFSLESVCNVHISNLSIIKEWSRPYDIAIVKYGVIGIQISGNSKDVHIEQITTDGCYRGFEIYNNDQDLTTVFPEDMALTPDRTNNYYSNYNSVPIARRIKFAYCRATISASFIPNEFNGQFGFHLNDCNSVLMLDCHVERQYLDGIKVRKNTKNVSIQGGSSRFNGRAILSSAYSGDGIDAYAGGDTLTITDTVVEYNTAYGIMIKSGSLNSFKNILPNNDSLEHHFGDIGSVQLIGVKCCYNMQSGMIFSRDKVSREGVPKSAPFENSDVPKPIGLTVIGGIFNHNNEAGIVIAAGEHVSIIGSIIGNNKGAIYACVGLQIGFEDVGANPYDATEDEMNNVHPRNVIVQGVHIFSRKYINPSPQPAAVKIVAANRLLLDGVTINGNTDYPNNSAPLDERKIYYPIFKMGQVILYEQSNIYVTNTVVQNV